MKRCPIHLVRETVHNVRAYASLPSGYRVKLDQNEHPSDLPPEIKEEILGIWSREKWNRYPDMRAAGLRETMGQVLSVPSDMIVVGNGSNEILKALLFLVLNPDRRMVIVEPTFGHYRHYGQIYGAGIQSLSMAPGFRFPVDALVENASDPSVSLVVLCTPNNPTGNALSRTDAVRILDSAKGFVLMDEAYGEFADEDMKPLLFRYPNLILMRTLSKAFGFASGRFGYSLTAPQMSTLLERVLLPYRIGGFTQAAAAYLFRSDALLEPRIRQIIAQRNILLQRLSQIDDLTVYPSQANFLLIRPTIRAQWLSDRLKDRSILVRDVSTYPGLYNHLRITVGDTDENDLLIRSLYDIMDSVSKSKELP